MHTYRFEESVTVFVRNGNKVNGNAIRKAVQQILGVVEANEKNDECLDRWASALGNGVVYITLSNPQLSDPCWMGFECNLLIESTRPLDLMEPFESCPDMDLDAYDQLRDLRVYDATSDYSDALAEWQIKDQSVIVVRYDLIEPDIPGEPPHFAADIYLCNDV